MAGISAATIAKIGVATVSLLNATKNNNQKIDYLSQNQQSSINKRKNLLEQQLASRRSGLGAMGITSSKSAAAVQQRLVQDTYNDIADDNRKYKQQYENLQDENQRNIRETLLNSVISTTGKIIK